MPETNKIRIKEYMLIQTKEYKNAVRKYRRGYITQREFEDMLHIICDNIFEFMKDIKHCPRYYPAR